LKPRVEALTVGLPTDADAAYGPLITAAHRKKVLDYIDLGMKEGAELVVDGRGFKMQAMRKTDSISAVRCSIA